ncbi:MAG: glgE2 [Verrucomicrobiales bacterium]|nr:glgE2 [Verrucomicrobiales bacterium]
MVSAAACAMPVSLTQTPAPGSLLIRHAGDDVTFSLTTSEPVTGVLFLRTNLRQAARQRDEIIAAVEESAPPPGLDWEDLPFLPDGAGGWTLTLPLPEVGSFEARAFLLTDELLPPVWPDTPGNVRIKVEPAWTVAGNSIYAAFPRLFRDSTHDRDDQALQPLDDAGYTVIPPSGTFRAVRNRLDHIIGNLGFGIVLLLPPFPVPTTHARMGRYGSPFAALDFFNVDPAQAEFDSRTTPLQQFRELTDSIHSRGARVFIDIPINHTGWASQLMAHHPDWFVRNDDGTFHSPGAWGVVWADLVKLDYTHRELWKKMAEVFLYWCRQGVDGFRCDAGYFVPLPVWRYITAKVRREFPDTVFLLEGLGGPIPVMLDLLTEGGLNWAYSELFQNESRGAMDWYLPQAIAQSKCQGYQVNFAETHDNARLAAVSPMWAQLRTAVAALSSPAGGWGLTCGAEWFATEQIRVHGATSLAEGSPENQIGRIAVLQEILRQPAFAAGAELQLITTSSGSAVVLRRVSKDQSQTVLVLMNLDPEQPAEAAWPAADFPSGSLVRTFCGLPPDAPVWADNQGRLTLPPGTVCLLSAAPLLESPPSLQTSQQAAALARRLASRFPGKRADFQPDPDRLLAAPAAWCQALTSLPFAPVTTVTFPRDERREVVWLPGDFLLLTAPEPFRYSLSAGGESLAEGLSLPGKDFHFTLIPRPQDHSGKASVLMRLPNQRGTVPLFLPTSLTHFAAEATGVQVRAEPDLHVILTNGTGAMSHLRAAWGTVRSQYDALLAANPHPDYPIDRRMVVNRCRAWIVRRGFSTEVSAQWTTGLRMASEQTAIWDFRLPCGDGHWIHLSATVHLTEEQDAVSVTFKRLPGDRAGVVTLILRPDVEDRGFHEKWNLPEDRVQDLDRALTVREDGFHMPCRLGRLRVSVEGAKFVREPERLTVDHPIDASRGLGGNSNLFSPGYFTMALESGHSAMLSVGFDSQGSPLTRTHPAPSEDASRQFTLLDAVRQFIVKRDDSLTVIAGYPWFLDWGRDTLICLRGIAAAGELGAVREILKTFARYEKDGTLPNMIRGGDDSNRDTSDAPLWFFTSVADLIKREGHDNFLAETAGGRTVREVLVSLGQGYVRGTPNGIVMDPLSGLIYSPPHFTWMDTNYPAGTPRQGYPISIQALWFDALRLLSKIDSDPQWPRLAAQVQQSILTYFTRPGQPWLSDCLHGQPGQCAAECTADDHLRPNQLLAVTLGAVTDPDLCTGIIEGCLELLVPGALRTLADRRVSFALPIERNGQLLNHPLYPFWPHYEGDEDTRRKPAYHNGTAWPWVMPMLAEAMLLVHGPSAKPRAAGMLASSAPLFQRFSLGSLEEIIDGGYPHAPRGCGSQAWSITEWVRVKKLLEA